MGNNVKKHVSILMAVLMILGLLPLTASMEGYEPPLFCGAALLCRFKI